MEQRHTWKKLYIVGIVFLLSAFNASSYASNTTTPASHLAATLSLVKLEAKEGDQQLQLYLGQAYLFGLDGVEQDPLQAMYWLELAAIDDSQVKKLIAQLFHYGEGLPKNNEMAFHWYMKAAKAGDVEAMERVASFYATGMVETDDSCSDAIAWYQNAAGKGSILSRRNLVWLYSTCPNPNLRDGDLALKIAKQLIARLPQLDASDFDNLAAAYAACGEFDKAIEAQRQAMASLGNEDGIQTRYQTFQQRLEHYKQHRIWIDE